MSYAMMIPSWHRQNGTKIYSLNVEKRCSLVKRSLYLFAGIHPCHDGYHYMLSHKFPFAVYYEISNDAVVVVIVLDMRRNPVWIHRQLGERESEAHSIFGLQQLSSEVGD